jgi:hypothetical protein
MIVSPISNDRESSIINSSKDSETHNKLSDITNDKIHLSLIIDDNNQISLDFYQNDDIEILCKKVCHKYNLNQKIAKKLKNKIQKHISNITIETQRSRQKEKNLIERLHYKSIEDKKKKEKFLEHLKKEKDEKQLEGATFSPVIYSTRPKSNLDKPYLHIEDKLLHDDLVVKNKNQFKRFLREMENMEKSQQGWTRPSSRANTKISKKSTNEKNKIEPFSSNNFNPIKEKLETFNSEGNFCNLNLNTNSNLTLAHKKIKQEDSSTTLNLLDNIKESEVMANSNYNNKSLSNISFSPHPNRKRDSFKSDIFNLDNAAMAKFSFKDVGANFGFGENLAASRDLLSAMSGNQNKTNVIPGEVKSSYSKIYKKQITHKENVMNNSNAGSVNNNNMNNTSVISVKPNKNQKNLQSAPGNAQIRVFDDNSGTNFGKTDSSNNQMSNITRSRFQNKNNEKEKLSPSQNVYSLDKEGSTTNNTFLNNIQDLRDPNKETKNKDDKFKIEYLSQTSISLTNSNNSPENSARKGKLAIGGGNVFVDEDNMKIVVKSCEKKNIKQEQDKLKGDNKNNKIPSNLLSGNTGNENNTKNQLVKKKLNGKSNSTIPSEFYKKQISLKNTNKTKTGSSDLNFKTLSPNNKFSSSNSKFKKNQNLKYDTNENIYHRLYTSKEKAIKNKEEHRKFVMKNICPFVPKISEKSKQINTERNLEQNPEQVFKRLSFSSRNIYPDQRHSRTLNSFDACKSINILISPKSTSKSNSPYKRSSSLGFGRNSKISNLDFSSPCGQSRGSVAISTDRNRSRIREIREEKKLYNSIENLNLQQDDIRQDYSQKFRHSLGKFKLNNFKEIFEVIYTNCRSIEDFQNMEKFGISTNTKEKLVLPACHIIKERNLEFNFQNFYLIANEIMNYLL